MSPKFSDSPLPRWVPASVPVNHGRQAPSCCWSGPLANPDTAQGPTWCRDLRSVCSAGQVPACSSPSSYPSCSSGAPSYSRVFQLVPSNVRPPPGLDIKEISPVFFFALKWGLLQMHTRGSLWEALPITCFYIGSFMPGSLKAFSQTSVIVSPFQMAQRGKHRNLSGSTKVTQKVRAEVGTEPRTPRSQACHLPLPGRAGTASFCEGPSHTPCSSTQHTHSPPPPSPPPHLSFLPKLRTAILSS